MIATIISLNGGLLTTFLSIHNQYLVSIDSEIKLSVCLSVCLSVIHVTVTECNFLCENTHTHSFYIKKTLYVDMSTNLILKKIHNTFIETRDMNYA